MSTAKLDKIAKLDAEMEEIKKKKAKLLQEHNAQERKARNSRLIKRSAMIEKLIPGLANLSDEQFDTFVKRTLLTSFAENKLREIESAKPKNNPSPAGNNTPTQEENKPMPEHQKSSPQHETAPTPKPVNAAHGNSNGGYGKPAQSQPSQPRADASA